MIGSQRRMLFRLIFGALIPLALYVFFRLDTAIDIEVSTPKGHFYVVSVVALLATVIAVAMGMSATKLRNIKVTFISLSFISLASIFSVHGLSTPGFLIRSTHLPEVAAQLAVTLTALWLFLSAASSDNPLIAFLAKKQQWIVPVYVCLILVAGTYTLIQPDVVDWLPLDRHPLKWPMLAITLVLTLFTARRYWTSYRYSGFPLQYAVTLSALWMAGAQIIMTTGIMWHLSWWIYHFMLLGATVATMLGLLRQYASGESLSSAVIGLFKSDPVARIEDGISPSIRALILATEARDTYTAGHNFRVALYALRIAEDMGVQASSIRALAQGGIVHDVGKIQVPDSILNKPGALTPEERAVIERHPVTGYEMCKRLGFMNEELDIIRHHHERWDGAGYPDGLKEEEIPLLARILAVADVYDALTSVRAYRKAWNHEKAMEFLLENAGSQFDRDCVQAWVRVSQAGLRIDKYPSWSLLSGNEGA